MKSTCSSCPSTDGVADLLPLPRPRRCRYEWILLHLLLSVPNRCTTDALMANAFSSRRSHYCPNRFSVSSLQLRKVVNGFTSSTLPSMPSANNGSASSTEPDKAMVVLRHVAIVCDGNSRWAQRRNLPTAAGHAVGAERLVEVIRALRRTPGVTHCTLYGFSTENWKRPASEIRGIFTVMEQAARFFYNTLLDENIIVKMIGDLDDARIPRSLREALQQLERATHAKHADDATGNVVTVCLAVNYGGRQDIINASKRIAMCIADGTLDPESVSEASFADYLDTAGVPDPDLLIRTSGENRLSNFMLWNAAYAELYFTETLWPDFDADAVQAALDWYAQRQRRFGAREQGSSWRAATSKVL